MNYKEAKEKAQKMHDKLTGYEFTKNKKARIISVKHCDGSYLEFHSATFEKLDKEWTAVFTEHHGMIVYHFEDVEYIKEISNINMLQGWNSVRRLRRRNK